MSTSVLLLFSFFSALPSFADHDVAVSGNSSEPISIEGSEKPQITSSMESSCPSEIQLPAGCVEIPVGADGPRVCCQMYRHQNSSPFSISEVLKTIEDEIADKPKSNFTSQSWAEPREKSLLTLRQINACAMKSKSFGSDLNREKESLKYEAKIVGLLKLFGNSVAKVTEVMKGCEKTALGDDEKNRSVVMGNGVAYVASAKALGVEGEVSHSSLLTELVLNGSKTAQVAGQCVQRVVGAVEETLGEGKEYCKVVDKLVEQNYPSLKPAHQEPVKPIERIGDKAYCESPFVVADLEQYQESEPGVCVHAGPDNIGQMCCITDSAKKPEMISWEDLARRIYGRVCDNPDEVGDYPSDEYQNRIASVLKAVESDFKELEQSKTLSRDEKNSQAHLQLATLNQLVAAAQKLKTDINSDGNARLDFLLEQTLAKHSELKNIPACKSLSPEELERKLSRSYAGRSPIPAIATKPAPGPELAREVASNSPAQITYPSSAAGSANSTPSVTPAPKSYEEAFGREVGKDILNWMGVSSAPTPSEPDYFTAMQSLLGSSASAPKPNAMQPAAVTPKITSNVTEKPLESSSNNASSTSPTESQPTPSSTEVAKPNTASAAQSETPKAASSAANASVATKNPSAISSEAPISVSPSAATTANSENDRTARFRSVKHYWEQDQASGNRKLADAIKGLTGVDDLAGKNSDSTGKDFQNLLVKNNPSSVLNTLLASSDFTEIPRAVGEKKNVIHPDAPNKTGSAESLQQTADGIEIVRSLRQGGSEGRYALNGNRNNAEASNLRTLRTPGGRLVTDGGISQNAGASYNPNDTFSYASNAIYGHRLI